MGTYCAKNNNNYGADLPNRISTPPALNEAALVGENDPACEHSKCEVPYTKGKCADECYTNPFCRYFFHVSTTGLCQLYSGCPALRPASKKFSGHGNAALQTSAVYALYADGHQGCVTAYNVSVSNTYGSSRWKPVDGGRIFRPP